MKLAKVRLPGGEVRLAVAQEGPWRLLVAGRTRLDDLLHATSPAEMARDLVDGSVEAVPEAELTFLAPIDQQEVWAAGVTYKRSQVARMEESETAATNYDRVYTAPRPEIFFKATPSRVSGPGMPLRVRADSQWSVPEPELALVINPAGKLVGYTIGNDMSARDIEGENPLYLPQAKMYQECCGLGPCVLLADGPMDRAATSIKLTIARAGEAVVSGETNVEQMKRGFDELIGWLMRDNLVTTGAFLLTGTGIVPADNFTLRDGDEVAIEISGIGRLVNPIVQGTLPS